MLESPDLKMRSRSRKLIFTASAISISTVITIVLLESLLHIEARMFPQVEAVLCPPQYCGRSLSEPYSLPDDELGIRGNPKFPEHDVNGFRNVVIPETADVVAIGDSHTYGTTVAADQSWPRMLETLSSCRVYSMALGGYGPLQYEVLARRAVRYKPRFMLVGIYFGNDFYDNWEMYLRSPSRYPVPKELLNSALEREQHNPLSLEVEDFYGIGPTDAERQTDAEKERAWSLRYFLAQNSSLWGLARAVKNKLFPPRTVLSDEFETAVAALTPKQLEYASIFDGTDWRTILTSRYREVAENIDDPRIKVGIWLTRWAVQSIDHLAKENDMAATFILLPTKESVFVDKVKVAGDHNFYKKLTAEEDQIRRDLIQYMEQNKFVYIDMAPALRSMVQQPYNVNVDGHPNAAGQKAIATKVLEYVGLCKH